MNTAPVEQMVRPISEIRKPEIVAGAIAALNKHGLSMISFDLIADEADMSRQLIRHYFPDTEALMVAVCDGLAAVYKDALMRGILATKATERLPMFLDFYFDLLGDKDPAKDPAREFAKPRDDAAYDAMLSVATGCAAVRRNLHDQYQLLQMTIAHEVQISNPTLPQSACREIGFLFVSLMYGHWKMVATLGFSEDHNRVTRAAVDRLIASYVAHYDDPDRAEAPGEVARD